MYKLIQISTLVSDLEYLYDAGLIVFGVSDGPVFAAT